MHFRSGNVFSDTDVVGSSCKPIVVMGDDRLWFEHLVRTLGRPAMKFANVLVHDIDLSEEIVQEAFARAWASPKCRHRRSSSAATCTESSPTWPTTTTGGNRVV